MKAVAIVQPDVVLTDIRMPPTLTNEGIRVAAALREQAPEIGVVVLSQYAEPGYVVELLGRGSDRRGEPLQGGGPNRGGGGLAGATGGEGGARGGSQNSAGGGRGKGRPQRPPPAAP